jgi:hypothetical protein
MKQASLLSNYVKRGKGWHNREIKLKKCKREECYRELKRSEVASRVA